MQLHYWQGSNFGDELNLWLWPRLFGEPLDKLFSSNTLFCGVGTILNAKLPTTSGDIRVFGSGAGYGGRPTITDRWTIYCVRGPLTAQALELDPEFAVTDAAMLIREYFSPSNRRSGVAFMPHHTTARSRAWELICEGESIRYLDPAGDVAKTVGLIQQSELVLAEAMHAAIIADSLRVPWIPVRSSPRVLDFKWTDWTSSLGIGYEFSRLPVVHERGRRQVLTKPVAARLLRRLVRSGRPLLSDDQQSSLVYSRLLDRFGQLREDAQVANL